ncbi:MAG: anaerobic ribonucleoside-triphosphate reductase activating protein [Rickettsiales bacterium]|jgi:pyruvate formate lyase activating enzyme|nr:anaerobic ribonucleoside-triphosphate reductase activating protein [Rickettsiales bacterium]
MLKIADLTRFSLQDFPGRTACIIWFAGCNMCCRYCHNITLLRQTTGFLTEQMIFDFLKSRTGLVDGVVLSGGECTLGGYELIEFAKKIKKFGFKIKIDSNGLNLSLIEKFINESLVDFIALDYKSPREKFDFITNTKGQFDIFVKTLDFVIKNTSIEKEIRTTVHTDLLNEDDINNIFKHLEELGYNGVFYLQNFRNDNGMVTGLGEQKFRLNREKIYIPKLFEVKYRNFF